MIPTCSTSRPRSEPGDCCWPSGHGAGCHALPLPACGIAALEGRGARMPACARVSKDETGRASRQTPSRPTLLPGAAVPPRSRSTAPPDTQGQAEAGQAEAPWQGPAQEGRGQAFLQAIVVPGAAWRRLGVLERPAPCPQRLLPEHVCHRMWAIGAAATRRASRRRGLGGADRAGGTRLRWFERRGEGTQTAQQKWARSLLSW